MQLDIIERDLSETVLSAELEYATALILVADREHGFHACADVAQNDRLWCCHVCFS
jgi:hypothetical protein